MLIMKRSNFKPELWLQTSVPNEAQEYFTNDVFSKHLIKCGTESENLSDLELVYPATEYVINKYKSLGRVNVNETPELYRRFRENYVQKIDPHFHQWIDTFFKSSESEVVLFRNEHFVLGKTYLTSYSVCGI